MRGIVIYCPSCRKPILRDAYLRIGSRLSIRCFGCGAIIVIESTPVGIVRKEGAALTDKIAEPTMKAEDEDSGFAIVET